MGTRTRRTAGRAAVVGAAMALAFGLVLVRSEGPATAQTATPDIEVKSFTARVAGTSVDYSLTICVNNALPGAFQVKIWLDLATAPTCTTPAPDVDAPLSFSGLGCQTIPLSITGLAPGSYTTRVLVDATCAVTETSETNNTGAVSYTIVGAVTYKAGPAKYVGVSGKKHASDGGERAMNADCHATYPGSRLCRDIDIAATFPAPQPPEDAWVLPTHNGPFTTGNATATNAYACTTGQQPYTGSFGSRSTAGTVLAATGKTVFKRVQCEGAGGKSTAYPAACCRP